MELLMILLSFTTFEGFASASQGISAQTGQREQLFPLPTPFPLPSDSNSYLFDGLGKRQAPLQISTCGYNHGDPNQPRTANPGFNCRVDTKNGLWGFCPTTVIAATDCGLAGCCVDGSSCSDGCGILGVASITTFTCNGAKQEFCSTALLIDGPDQTYSYIACAANAGTEFLFAAPTLTSTTASSTSKLASSKALSASSSTSTSLSSTSSSTTSLQSNSALSTSSAAPASASNTNTSTPDSKSNVGPIVGGVLGGLSLIGFFILAALFLTRKYQRNPVSSEVMPQQPIYKWRRSDPKIPPDGDRAYTDSNYPKYEGYGPSELSTGQEPVELGI